MRDRLRSDRTDRRLAALGFALGLAFAPVAAAAFTLEFPAPATALGERRADLTSYRLPTGPFSGDAVPTQLTEGSFAQTAWRLDAAGLTTLQLLAPLRAQVAKAGWTTLYECETTACGGFDFRYGIDVLPEPEMHVDLGDFRYLGASRKGPHGMEYLSLLVSRSADQGFVQMTLVGAETPPQLSASTKSPVPSVADAVNDALAEAMGGDAPAPVSAQVADPVAAGLSAGKSVVLEDLVFASGKADLAAGEYPSLQALADWLDRNAEAGIALVGHSDASGSLAGNTALSQQRADAIRAVLVGRFGIDPARITARGVGPASPIASNDTEEGRRMNRRVEVVPTPTR